MSSLCLYALCSHSLHDHLQTLLSPLQPPLLSLKFPGAGIPRAFGAGVISAALNVPVEDTVGNPAGDTCLLPEPCSPLEELPLC